MGEALSKHAQRILFSAELWLPWQQKGEISKVFKIFLSETTRARPLVCSFIWWTFAKIVNSAKSATFDLLVF